MAPVRTSGSRVYRAWGGNHNGNYIDGQPDGAGYAICGFSSLFCIINGEISTIHVTEQETGR